MAATIPFFAALDKISQPGFIVYDTGILELSNHSRYCMALRKAFAQLFCQLFRVHALRR